MAPENDKLLQLKTDLVKAGASWQAKDNRLSIDDMKLRCGFVPAADEPGMEEREDLSKKSLLSRSHFADKSLPAQFDLSNIGGNDYSTRIKNQGSCGSCVAFGTIAATEITTRYQKRNPSFAIDLSEAHLFYCHARSEGAHCRSGWQPARGFIAMAQKGVVTQSCFPYDPLNTPLACKLCSNWMATITFITGYLRIASVSEMKQALINNGALAACFSVYEDFRSYAAGVYHHVSGGYVGGHCVCVYGYDDTLGCWLAKNSWDTSWGDVGYFKIKYGECGIDSEMWQVYIN